MELINKDEIYILRQPEKLILSIIVIDQELKSGLSGKEHFNLGWMTDYSDIIFVFAEDHWNNQKQIDKEVFTSLYQGCGFISVSNKDLGTGIIKVLEYDREILSDTMVHQGYAVLNMSGLDNIDSPTYSQILNIVPYISRPVYEERRLDSSEFHSIYSMTELKETPLKKFPGRDKLWGIFKIIVSALKKRLDSKKEGMFSTWHTKSDLVYFPRLIINQILDYVDKDRDYFNIWSKTFITPDIRYFIASLVKHLRIEILNVPINNVKLK